MNDSGYKSNISTFYKHPTTSFEGDSGVYGSSTDVGTF